MCSSGIQAAISIKEELSSTLSVDEFAEGDHVDVAIPSRHIHFPISNKRATGSMLCPW